ncbi:MAG: outer membrane lipoprotein chaperone LolA [Gammaproteobacteria bacterium]|nr:outer membrane lipoprotein chaperone LolA [Gammaproteobacteria bacterium]
MHMIKVIKKITLVIATIFATAFSVAAEPVETELRKLLSDYDGFTARFSQKVTDVNDNLLHQAKGQLVFKQPGKFRWEVTEPEQELLLSNGKSLWWYNPFLEQVSIYDAEEAVSTTPFALLVSNKDETWNKFVIEKVESGFVITPKDDDTSQVTKLAVHFDKFLLTQIVITDRTQQTSAYVLSKHKFDKKLKHEFDFEIPESIDIDDQRQSSVSMN